MLWLEGGGSDLCASNRPYRAEERRGAGGDDDDEEEFSSWSSVAVRSSLKRICGTSSCYQRRGAEKTRNRKERDCEKEVRSDEN